MVSSLSGNKGAEVAKINGVIGEPIELPCVPDRAAGVGSRGSSSWRATPSGAKQAGSRI